MARFFCILIVVAALSAGCGSSPSLVDKLPEPNFNGPVIGGGAVAVAPTPQPVQPRTTPNNKKPTPMGDRAWAITAPPRSWKWIVIHHSATPSGSAAIFDKMHRQKGWDELGYHFVIGNGTDSGNGRIEVGPRWPRQKWGAHAKTPDNEFNNFGVGICLVGNFDIERPTQQQLQSLARLTAYLMKTYNIPPGNVLGHRDTKATECPGRNLNIALVRRMANQALADAGELNADAPRAASATEVVPEVPAANSNGQ